MYYKILFRPDSYLFTEVNKSFRKRGHLMAE
jgi:hypothetical protein